MLIAPELEEKAKKMFGENARLMPAADPESAYNAANPVYGMRSVSYTHLDVYKRQGQRNVPIGNGVYVGRDILRPAPSRAAVLLSLIHIFAVSARLSRSFSSFAFPARKASWWSRPYRCTSSLMWFS